MDLDALTDTFKNALDGVIHIEWLSILITVVVSLAVTAIVAHIVTLLLRKFLSSDATPLPSSSIFINIGRVLIWAIGICVILSSCFNVDVSAAITALGVGGIAISLGFQDTLSNLIGGLQLSLTKLVEPGDHIKVDGEEGIVHDVTWRHTSIVTTRGEYVIIPNSVINSKALKKLPKRTPIHIDIIVNPKDDESLTQITQLIEQAVDAAVSKIALLEQKN
jgi:small-conductance mechanosensitive channel